MFSLKIIDTDLFLDMPLSTQALYFHLSMRADDDGFISSPKKLMKMVGCNDDDYKILVAKQFLIPFESGVCVVKHWRIHNYIQTDRYNATFYKAEKTMLVDNDGSYELQGFESMDTDCIQDVDKMDTQVRLGKVRLELGKVSKEGTTKVACSNKLQPVIDKWNSLNLSKLLNIKGNRLKLLNTRISEYGLEAVLKAIDNINNSSFLKGQNKSSWIITFDWFVKPNNFPKVLEDNYLDKEVVKNNGCSGKNNAEIKGKYAGCKPKESTGEPLTDAEIADLDLI